MNTFDFITNEDKYNILAGRVPLLLNRFLSQQFNAMQLALSREQWSVLVVLWKADGCSQQMIAEATYRDKPSITRLIDNLVKEGYVVRSNDKNDRRLNLIFLTEKGKQIQKAAIQVIDDTINKATKGLSEDQMHAVRDAFELIYNNLKTHIK